MLRLLVVVEFAFDANDRAVEKIDRRPEERVEIGLEPRIGESGDERVKDGGDGGRCDARLRHRAWIGVAFERSMSVKLKLVEQMRGRRGGVERFEAVVFGCGHCLGPRQRGRAHRGLHGRRHAASGAGPHPMRSGGPERMRRTAAGR